MKSLVTVLSALLLFGAAAAAQDKTPSAAGNGKDTMQQMIDRGERPMCPHGRHMFPQGNGFGDREKANMMEPGFNDPRCGEFAQGNRHPFGGHRFMQCAPHRCFCLHILFKMLLLGFMLFGILNILLTIIVSLDMARNNRFNGLWIPVLLLAGIPGAMIYALFRIGDRVQCKSGN